MSFASKASTLTFRPSLQGHLQPILVVETKILCSCPNFQNFFLANRVTLTPKKLFSAQTENGGNPSSDVFSLSLLSCNGLAPASDAKSLIRWRFFPLVHRILKHFTLQSKFSLKMKRYFGLCSNQVIIVNYATVRVVAVWQSIL